MAQQRLWGSHYSGAFLNGRPLSIVAENDLVGLLQARRAVCALVQLVTGGSPLTRLDGSELATCTTTAHV